MSGRIRGLYGIADADAAGGDPERLAVQMLEGGCRLLQLRCKGWAASDTLVVARALVPRCRELGATLIINDVPEVAAASGADGVHVGQTDGPSPHIRHRLGPGRLLGRSANRLEELGAARDGADYVAFGPLYDTANLSRPKPVQGPALLIRARAIVPAHIPLVAIGGITTERLGELRAQADAWAVIGAIAGADDPVAATRMLL